MRNVRHNVQRLEDWCDEHDGNLKELEESTRCVFDQERLGRGTRDTEYVEVQDDGSIHAEGDEILTITEEDYDILPEPYSQYEDDPDVDNPEQHNYRREETDRSGVNGLDHEEVNLSTWDGPLTVRASTPYADGRAYVKNIQIEAPEVERHPEFECPTSASQVEVDLGGQRLSGDISSRACLSHETVVVFDGPNGEYTLRGSPSGDRDLELYRDGQVVDRDVDYDLR